METVLKYSLTINRDLKVVLIKLSARHNPKDF